MLRIPRIRTRFLLSALLAALLLLNGSAAWAAGRHLQKASKGEVEGLEQQWRAATLASDVPAMDRLLSDDYVGISWTGQVSTKAMQLSRVRDKTYKLNRLDLSDAKVKVLGPVAIVTARAQVEGFSDGDDMTGIYRYTRVYQRSPSGVWQITNFEATRVPDGAGRTAHKSH